MRDRYLFSADRKASEYRSLLEITRGRARLLTPSKDVRRVRWLVSLGLYTLYYLLVSPLFIAVSAVGYAAPVAGWIVFIAATALFFGGVFVVFAWWDQQSLPLLGSSIDHSVDLVLLGARSFGTFQDVRARTPWGEELHLVVDARSPRFWEAVRLLEGRPTPSG